MAGVLRRVVLDAGPIVSVLLDDEAAAEVAAAIANEEVIVSVVNVGEVLDVLLRVHRVPRDAALEAVGRFLDEVARAVPATREIAEWAAELRARHYHRRDRDVSLADCFVVATASAGDAVATSDSAVARVATLEGIEVVALPNPRGRRP